VSRRHWNEVYLDLARVPEVTGDAAVGEPSPGEVVDLPALAARKRTVLEAALARLGGARRDEFERWLTARPDVAAYARFRAAVERDGAGVRATGRGGDDDRSRYHAYVQWLVEHQLELLARRMRDRHQELYLDLPIGAHPDGFDVVTQPDLFATGASVGAPPDLFFAAGQNWGFPPVLPAAARADGYRYLRECVGTHLRFAGRLRVDHVIGLNRMWWVPDGAAATDGAYVHTRAEEQYAALTLAAAQADGRVVGENLGTVPPETNEALREHGMLGMYVAMFELRDDDTPPLPPPRADQLACLDTHDTATFAVWWRDLEPPARAAVLDQLGLTASASPADVHEAVLEFLGRSRAEVVLATLDDLWLETEPQNTPGTTGDERPNFRRRARKSLDELATAGTVDGALRRLDTARHGGTP
jgi:4-alpha-glucanotransferase